jgi:predicted dehydrogenase
VRILIAGLGAIGQRHARNLRAINPRVELLAYRRRRLPHVITEQLQRDDAQEVERELGFTRVFTELDAALDARPDAVFVCTPSSQHLEIAQRAADAGCHLFIEKPVSDRLDGLDRLRETVARNRLVAAIGCQWRWHPSIFPLKALKTLASEGAIDGLSSVEIDYAEYLPDWHPYEDYRASYAARADLGGGVVLTQIHDYDLAWWLFGPHTRVTATGGRLSSLDIDVEDTVDARLEGGWLPVRVRQTFAARPPRRSIRIDGADGSLTVDLVTGRASATASWAPLASGLNNPDYPRNDMFMDVARNFVASVGGDFAPSAPLDDGIEVLKLALAVKDSIRSGVTVEIM